MIRCKKRFPGRDPCTSAAMSRNSIFNRSGSATETLPVPLTVIALSFLLPITAPKPPCPATEVLAVWMVAMRDRFSPATPMVSVLTRCPSSV